MQKLFGSLQYKPVEVDKIPTNAMAVGGVLTSCASQGLLSAGAKHEDIFLLQNMWIYQPKPDDPYSVVLVGGEVYFQ